MEFLRESILRGKGQFEEWGLILVFGVLTNLKYPKIGRITVYNNSPKYPNYPSLSWTFLNKSNLSFIFADFVAKAKVFPQVLWKLNSRQ